LDAGQLGWLYDAIRNLFPSTEDPPIPDHVYSPTPRHDTSNFRDSIIGWLVKLATPDAIKELDRICESYPDTPWLIRARADTYKELWRRERTRISFSETIKLLSDANSTVVRNSRELMIVIEEALQRFAHEAQQGSPPLAVFLWNEKDPKAPVSEQRLSDFLKFYLEREWRGRRIIINREVEIQNWRDFGIGERTDILIQAFTPNSDPHQPHPCVVIEVKVDKNIKPEDIPKQLVKKYLDGESRNCGIYLVGWFGKSRHSIEELHKSCAQYALDNTDETIKIQSLILDLSHPLR
jgi:Uma2 family endonuclease